MRDPNVFILQSGAGLHGRRVVRGASAAAFLLASALVSPAGRAQPVDPRVMAAAQALHDQAVKALAARDYASACPKLEEVVRLVPARNGARLSLAECHEGAGRLASAWTTYRLAAEAAGKAQQTQQQEKAQARAQALEPRLARITLAVSDGARDLDKIAVQRDGIVVGPAQWGVPVPVDRGTHVIVATAAGKQRWEKTIEVSADGTSQTVDVDGLIDVPGPDRPPAAPAAGSGSAQRVAGIVVGAAGVVGLAVGTGFGIRAITTKHDSDPHCHAGDRCDATGTQLRTSSLAAGNWSTAMFVGGGLAVAGGVVLLLTAPRVPAAQNAIGPSGLTLRGRW